MKKVLFILTFLLSNLINAQDKIDVNLDWINGPKSFIESHLVITVETIETFNDIDIEMELWMPMMGHGSYPVAIKKETVLIKNVFSRSMTSTLQCLGFGK